MDENSTERKATSLQSNRAEHDRRIAEKLRRELGPQVCALLDDTKVIEIMLNPDGSLWCEWLGQPMERVGTMPKAQAESLMGTVASSLRTHITAANPILECELPLDGSRFEALLPPIVSGPTFTIRKKASIVFTLANYVKSGIMTETQCEAIKAAVRERRNILVVGGTGTGKTTLTNAIMRVGRDSCKKQPKVS
ncbi:ATPase, T2SS/T4P/T4SS family [Xanthomonas axonopodis]|uniref:ATPase, T2SS/T4P/T4SS family n=1 Tax=Xanthomonas axonopodis TaxID=53413 RepID=UPI001C4E0D43|nr:ATPase, T2SS/T4P/T4SS family [Xanthomonas axonopodis]